MPTITAFWNKLNANEKVVGYGIIVVLVSWLIGLVLGGGIGSSWAFVAAIVVAVIYWLKYAPNQSITWPAPIPLIVLVIAGIAALLSIVGLLGLFGLLFLGIGFLIAVLGNAVGSGLMAYGAWMEYQAMPKTTAPAAPPTSGPAAPPTAAPPSTPNPPAAPPPSSPPPPPGSV